MKNGFEVINSIFAECFRNGFQMIDVHYSLREQYAVFSARERFPEQGKEKYSTHLYIPGHGMISGQYDLTKAQASQSLIERFDDLQGGAQ